METTKQKTKVIDDLTMDTMFFRLYKREKLKTPDDLLQETTVGEFEIKEKYQDFYNKLYNKFWNKFYGFLPETLDIDFELLNQQCKIVDKVVNQEKITKDDRELLAGLINFLDTLIINSNKDL